MAEKRVQRRLAAILAADVVGYSRMMREDETGTLAQLKTLRKEVFDPRIAEHNGRIVKTTGDGVLVEFASAVDATECAVKIQRGLARRNEDVPEGHRIELRIGINLGDIIVDGDDIYGDGVNVAARLEGLCDTGEVYVSAVVRDQVEGKIEAAFEDLGEHTVKNIDKPIGVYRLNVGTPNTALGALPVTAPDTADRPSLAVLPFTNISEDPEQEYFADGMTEDLITDLSRISGIFVVARNSSFAYKGKSADLRQVGRELGVRHVLEGSVRKARERVRINAQLIDTATGGHLWAERYDGDFDDIFALQDEITGKIVSALKVTLTSSDMARVERKPTESTEAYDHLLKGRSEYYRYSPESNAKAIEHLSAAIELDPAFADAHSYLSYCYFTRFAFMLPGADPDLIPAVELAEKAVSLDPGSAVAHARLAWVQGFLRRFDESLPNFEKSIVLDPNNAETYAAYAEILNHWGDPERAIELNARAVAIDTIAPPNWEYHFGHGLWLLRRYDEALVKLRHAVELAPGFLPAHVRLACVYAELDRSEEAEQVTATILKLQPRFSIAFWDQFSPYRTDEQRERFRTALRKAGLPE